MYSLLNNQTFSEYFISISGALKISKFGFIKSKNLPWPLCQLIRKVSEGGLELTTLQTSLQVFSACDLFALPYVDHVWQTFELGFGI